MNRFLSKLFDSEAAVVFLLIPFIKPACFENMNGLQFVDSIYDFYRMISFCIIIGCLIIHKHLSKTILGIIVFELSIFIPTIFCNGSILKFGIAAGSVIGFSILIDLGINYNSKVFFKSLFDLCFTLIGINFLLILMYPNGVATDALGSQINFMGIDNALSPILVTAMGIAVIYGELWKRKIQRNIMLVLISATFIITWSATGIVGWFIVLIYILFFYKKKCAFMVQPATVYPIYILMFVSIVVLRLQDNFAFIIEKILKKNVSFTGRTAIWDKAIFLIKESPVFGYGVRNSGMINMPNGYAYYAHNAFLETMLQGGTIALIFFVVLFIISGSKLQKFKYSGIAGIITAMTFAMITMMMMESYYGVVWVFAVLIMGSNCDIIIEQIKTNDSFDKSEDIHISKRYIYYRLKQR